MNQILLLSLLLISSCRTLGGFTPNIGPAFIGNTINSRPSTLTFTEKDYENINFVRKQKLKSHDNNDLSFSIGRYVQKHGILRELGESSLTFGAELSVFSSLIKHSEEKKSHAHGWFLLWTYDHIKSTNNVLKPEFKGLDYTNYMVGFGYAYRFLISNYWQFHYRGGLGINFLEIDTFRKNGDPNDSKYTDTTISTIHKIGIDYKIKTAKDIRRESLIRFGPSFIYYYSPELLRSFSNRDVTPGGSIGFLMDLKFEFY